MASNFQKTIEFKVKRTDLNRAVEKLFKDLKKIDLTVDEINKGTKILNKELKQSTVEIKKAEKATKKWGQEIARAAKASNNLANTLLKLVRSKTGIGSGGGGPLGWLKLAGEATAFDKVLRKLTNRGLPAYTGKLIRAGAALSAFGLAHADVITGLVVGVTVIKGASQAFYGLAKAAVRAERSIARVVTATRQGGLQGGLKSLFPDMRGVGGEKIKKAVQETQKLAKETEKVAYKYKEAATGLNKLREQLDKTRKIQGQLLSSSKGYLNVTRNVLKLEKEIAKEEKKREGILNRLTKLERLRKSLGGTRNIIKGAGEGLSGIFGADAAIRKLSGLLGKQIGLYEAVTQGGEAFFKSLNAIKKAAGGAIVSLDNYGRQIVKIVSDHQRLVQSTIGVLGGLDAVGRFTPQIYNLGKAFRQLQHDVGTAYSRIKQFGVEGGLLSFAPKGSHMGNRFDKLQGEAFDGQKAYKGIQKEWRNMGEHPGNIKSHVEGLTKVNKILGDNHKIQEGINTFTKRHVQATIAVRKAQTAVNHELLRAKATQALFNADIWVAQRAWNGLLSTLQKAGGLLGKLTLGLFTGKTAGSVGQAAGIIGASRGIEDLIQKVPLLSQALKDNIQTFAAWTRRVTEAVASVSIAYTGLSTALSAAKWVTGAVTGFINWEKQAAQSIWNVQRAFNSLDQRMARNLDQGKGLLAGLGNWLGGGDERKEKKRATLAGPTRAQRIESELAKQRSLLEARNTSAKDYLSILSRILKLERIQTKEIAQRRRLSVKAGADPNKVFKAEIDAVEKALEAQEALREKVAKKAADIEDKRVQRRIKEDEKANKIAMAAKQKIWDAEGKAWEQRMRWADKERLAEKKYQEQLKRRKEARKQKMGRLGENLMLGAGFPLLFGGGAGAVGGGVLGAGLQAMAGSQGFGMQILFSALGQQLDAFMGKTAELGQAFSALDKDATPLVERLGVAGTKFERHIKLLEKLGAEEEAFALAREEMLKLVGDKGVNDLTEFGKETQELGNAWGKLVTQMQAGLAGLINTSGILRGLVDGINRQVVLNQAIANVGNDQKLSDINAQIARYASGEIRPGGIAGRGPDAGKNVFKDFPSLRDLTNQLVQRQMFLNQGNRPDLTGAVEKVTIDKILEEQKLIQMKIDLGDKEAAIQQKINEIMKENKDLNRDKVEAAVRAVARTEEEYEALKRVKAAYEEIGATIKSGMVSAIESAIDGTQRLGEIASNVLRQIARAFIQAGLSQTLGAGGLKIPGFAKGGNVKGGGTYVVGEKGPELFTPTSSGHITPNHELGGSTNVTVNVDASGTDVQGDEPNAEQLGRLIAMAVQSEIVKQKRPGGLLTH